MEHHYLKQFDKELMKKAMLKHEKTFKQQVYELHRLYRLQKQLMREMRSTNYNNYKELKRQRDSSFSRSPKDDHEEQLLELTLAIGCPKKKRGNANATTSPASDSNNSFNYLIEYDGVVNHEKVPYYGADRLFHHAVAQHAN